MDAHAIAIVAGIIAGYFIFEVKAEDFIDLSRVSSTSGNSYAIGERQGQMGVMDLNYNKNDVFGSTWYRLRLHEDDTIDFDAILLDPRFPGHASRMAEPLSGPEVFNLYTNRPGADNADFYSMIFDTSAMYSLPEFAERGYGWGRRDDKFPKGGPWERATRPWETVPEPMAVSLVGISGIGLLFARRWFRKN